MSFTLWPLLIPAMEMSSAMGKLSFIPAAGKHYSIATVGFFEGFVFMMILDVALG